MRLNPVALGIALGAFWGVSLCLTTWISFYTGYAELFLEALAKSIYPGYSISLLGGLLGLGYGFLDGLVGGIIIGWLYNKLLRG